jgi:arsenate reductase
MGEIATSERQISLYYNPESNIAEKTLAFAVAQGLPILEIDILKNPPTGTQLGELSDRLNLKIKDLVNLEHEFCKSISWESEFSSDDWIKMIRKNPEIMKQPIALRGDKTIIVHIPTDILNI